MASFSRLKNAISVWKEDISMRNDNFPDGCSAEIQNLPMRRLIVGISGASGAIMGYELLKALKGLPQVETHLVITEAAKKNFRHEAGMDPAEVESLADAAYRQEDMGAAIASGSFMTDGMIILPCSMKTVAGVVSGYSDNLLLRAADVCLKENRTLVIAPREMPLSRIHLRNIKEAADCGCIVIPPMLTFYNGADTVEKQIHHIIGKILGQFGLEYKDFVPWKG